MKYSLVLVTAMGFFTLTSFNQAIKNSAETVEPPQSAITKTKDQPSGKKDNTAIKLNPPHGEPNHRCDIPVGAPLSSPPANAPQISTNNQIKAAPSQNTNTAPVIPNNSNAPTIENAKRINSTQTSRTAPLNTGTKPRLNPPHGQPWHRCEIAVGSPLP